jgi:hypothetical protein
MEPDTAVLFKPVNAASSMRGVISGVTDHESDYGDKLYRLTLDDGTVRWAFPDEITSVA